MINGYGVSLVGTSHIKKGTVCQDAHKYLTLKNGWIVATIADGVGSSKHSEIASQIAVDTVIGFFENQKNLEWKPDITDKFLPKAYAKAQQAIEEFALSKGDEFFDYDTTLDVVIYNGQEVAYGHSGDGGIVGLTIDGDYVAITKPQKSSDGFSVIPLRGGRQCWQFGRSKHNFASVLLATDGVYDTFFPYLLKGQGQEVYVPLIRFFMDNNVLRCSKKNIQEIKASRIDFLQSESYASVDDDKTLLVILNLEASPKVKNEKYYAEPDWAALQAEWNKKAYPHLHKEDAKKSKILESESDPSANDKKTDLEQIKKPEEL